MKTDNHKIITRENKRFVFMDSTLEDIDEIASFSELPKYHIANRFKNGDSCYLGKDLENNNKIVATLWYHAGPAYIKGFGYKLLNEPNDTYLYNGLSAPEVRLTGIFNTLMKEIHEYRQKQGCKTFFALIEFWNNVSFRYHTRLNYEVLHKIFYIKILIFRFSIMIDEKSKKKKIHLFFSDPEQMHKL